VSALEEAEEIFLTVNVDLAIQCCSPMKDPKNLNKNVSGIPEKSSVLRLHKEIKCTWDQG